MAFWSTLIVKAKKIQFIYSIMVADAWITAQRRIQGLCLRANHEKFHDQLMMPAMSSGMKKKHEALNFFSNFENV